MATRVRKRGKLTESEAQEHITHFLTIMRDCVKHSTRLPDGLVYAGPGDLLLKHGHFYRPQPKPRGYICLQNQACFANAQFYANQNKSIRYVEGYAFNIIPQHHAWLTDSDGNVIEITWEKPGDAYFGVEFIPPKKFKSALLENPKLYFKEWGLIYATISADNREVK